MKNFIKPFLIAFLMSGLFMVNASEYSAEQQDSLRDINIPTSPNIIEKFTDESVISSIVKNTLDDIIESERSGKFTDKSLRNFMAIEDALKYLGPYVDTQSIDFKKKNNIFSEKYFLTVEDVERKNKEIFEKGNILNASHKEKLELYKQNQSLLNLGNTISQGSALDVTKANPFLLLLSAEEMREIFFEVSAHNYGIPIEKAYKLHEDGYNKWNKTAMLPSEETLQKMYVGYQRHSSGSPLTFDKFVKNLEDQRYPRNLNRTFEEFLTEVFNKYFSPIPKEVEPRREYFLSHDIGFLNKPLIKNTFKAAEQIMNLSKEGDSIVLFGNTPYFVGRALEHIISHSKKGERKVIYFPFSGSPNRIRPGNSLQMKDIVTPERLSHLKKRLSKEGLFLGNSKNLKNTVYFVDVIASGGGPSYVIEEILRAYKNRNVQLPKIEIISLNKINIDDQSDLRNASISKVNISDGKSGTLYFPNKENPHFEIPVHVAFLDGHSEYDMIAPHFRIFPEYNAIYWDDKFDFLLSEQKTYIQQLMIEHFDTNFEEIYKGFVK